MARIIIYRDQWLRGTGMANGELLTVKGKYDLLYKIGRSCGIPSKHMIRVADPATLWDKRWPRCLVKVVKKKPFTLYKNTKLCWLIMKVNDNHKTSDAHKEGKLKKLILPHGYKVVFKDTSEG